MAATTLRLCHSGMDNRALYAFEIFLSRVGPGACRIAAEDAADVAFIDVDNDLGPYLLAGHRMLYPTRPLIVTTQTPGRQPDPLTVEVTKPVGLAAFSAALEKVRSLLPARLPEGGELPDAADERAGTVDSIPDESALDALRDPAPNPTNLLRCIEARMATLHVGSLPDADLDDPVSRATVFYAPEHFLQGLVARAIAHAREIGRPVRIDDADGAALVLDPRAGQAWTARSPNALRALAQLPTRGTLRMASQTPDAALPEGAHPRQLEGLEWDLALWASRGRLPRGTSLEHPIRLKSWPNLTRFAAPPEAMRIAGLWSRSSLSLRDTVRSLGVPQRYVFAFYSACSALGHVEQIAPAPGEPRAALAPPAAVPMAPPSRGRIKRLFGKLLGPRQDEPGPN
ncbi:MAG: hypothetical protein PHI64_16395 [Zoogloea sp.]|uniref:hypothetical protein n=1 Tax=Zoogloea sp. TaxID=49181 RepID=UPI002626E135|nr:hypothetical protein [Zoogloea sp.]MDD2990522.1 hypothetical protein [Zoogloea sp.]